MPVPYEMRIIGSEQMNASFFYQKILQKSLLAEFLSYFEKMA